MKFLKISVLFIAVIHQAITIEGKDGPRDVGNRLSYFKYGDGKTSSAILGDASSLSYEGSRIFPLSGVSGAKPSQESARGSSVVFGQQEAPKSYNFDYKSSDEHGNSHYHKEEADATGTVRGSYGYTNIQGLYRIVDYIADISGFRASIRTNEPGTDNKSPANVQIHANQPSAGIPDRYTMFSGIDGPRDSTSRTPTGKKIKFDAPLIAVRNTVVHAEPPASTPHIATVVRETYKTQVVHYSGSAKRPQSDEEDDEEE